MCNTVLVNIQREDDCLKLPNFLSNKAMLRFLLFSTIWLDKSDNVVQDGNMLSLVDEPGLKWKDV